MRYQKLPVSFFQRNRQKLRENIKENSLIILLSNNEMHRNGDQDFAFRQNSDLFYLSGLDQEKTIVTLCPDHPDKKLREIAFVIQTNEKLETWQGHKYTPQEATEISGIENIKWTDEFEETLAMLMYHASNVYINTNEQQKYIPDVVTKQVEFANKLREKYPMHNFERLAPVMKKLRMVKEPEELNTMQEACNITQLAFEKVLEYVTPGVYEFEVEAEMTREFIRHGATGHAYEPIVASGASACVLHYVDNDKKCKDGDLLLMDFGAEYANYAADCSRTIPVNGKYTETQKTYYNELLNVQKEAIKLMQPGTTIREFHNKVVKLIEQAHIRLGLYTQDEADQNRDTDPLYFKYYMHGTSHYIGLDVHDVGGKDDVFEKGMVLTCEPGLYLKDEGIGIRIEDNIMVDDTPFNLMRDIPKEADEIEKMMNG